jgi:energy-coupling factor transport system ATP-binding protein
MKMGKTIIEMKDVSFRYEHESDYALQGVNLSVYEGEWLAIVGHNGSGKSTMAKLLNGLQFPQGGQILIRGMEITEEKVWDIRKQIGMVFQNPDNQFVGTTVQDDVAFGLENNGLARDIMTARVIDSLRKVKMEEFLNQEPHHLSGGQKQRVAIAGVLALQPAIIILDESTSMLDPIGREEVFETVRKLKEDQDMTVISITHDLDEAAKADRIIVMNKGKVYREGTPDEIFQLDQELVGLGLDIPFSVKVSKQLRDKGVTLAKHHLSEEELVNELWTLHFNK